MTRNSITAAPHTNSITAPPHNTMQVQSSVGRIIPFCNICCSHSSFDEDWSLLVYYNKLIGKMLLMCQSIALPQSEGKDVSRHVMKAYWDFEVQVTHAEIHYHTDLCGRLYALAF
jgi:hypothetical protein